jgi:hypothetical protein
MLERHAPAFIILDFRWVLATHQYHLVTLCQSFDGNTHLATGLESITIDLCSGNEACTCNHLHCGNQPCICLCFSWHHKQTTLPPKASTLQRCNNTAYITACRRVLGVDATSAQTLSSLSMVLRRMGVTLIITRVTQRSIRRLLAAHGLISPADAAAAAAAEGGSNAVSRQHSSAAAAAAGGGQDPELQQPLLQGEEGDQEGSYCRVFDSLSAGAKYAEDR